MTLLKLLALLIGLAIAMAGAALALNRLPWSQPPGAVQRLITYLTTNAAETRRDHAFPELRSRRYPLERMPLFLALNRTVEALGWEIDQRDAEAGLLRAVVTTRWLRFKDDVEVRLIPDEDGTRVEVRSTSRLGGADFGANARHVMDLYAALEQVSEEEQGNGSR